ncbi:hypothetical protein K443DRAFT_97418, partial [Laccaria amethystina LaAM-08-1]
IKLFIWRKGRSGFTLKLSLLIPGKRKDRIEKLMIYVRSLRVTLFEFQVILCASKYRLGVE